MTEGNKVFRILIKIIQNCMGNFLLTFSHHLISSHKILYLETNNHRNEFSIRHLNHHYDYAVLN